MLQLYHAEPWTIRISGTLALGWVAVSLLLVVNRPEDLGYEGEDTVANAMKKKEKGKIQKNLS